MAFETIGANASRCGVLPAAFYMLVVAGAAAWLGACSPAVDESDLFNELSRGDKEREAKEQMAERQPSGQRRGQRDRFAGKRRRMVEKQLQGRDITDPDVLEAMGRVPRHEFVLDDYRGSAYSDEALPIHHGQTISQPYLVALMTQLVQPTAESKALDVGTGSGYQAAVLAELCKEVYGVEIVEPLAEEAKQRLERLGYDNVEVRHGNGYRGWPEQAPFDVIIVAAAPKEIPQALVEQLAPGGRLIVPVGQPYQKLTLLEKRQDRTIEKQTVDPFVAFVPMTGETAPEQRE